MKWNGTNCRREAREIDPPAELQAKPSIENPFDVLRKAVVTGFCDPVKEISEQPRRSQEQIDEQSDALQSRLDKDSRPVGPVTGSGEHLETPMMSTTIRNKNSRDSPVTNDTEEHDDDKSPPEIFRKLMASVDEWTEKRRRDAAQAKALSGPLTNSPPPDSTRSDDTILLSPGSDICVRALLFNPFKFAADRRMVDWSPEASESWDESDDEASTPRHLDPVIDAQRMKRRATADELTIPSLEDNDDEDESFLMVSRSLTLAPRPPRGILKKSSLLVRPKKPHRSRSSSQRRQSVWESVLLTLLAVMVTFTALRRLGYRVEVSLHRKAPTGHSPSGPFRLTVRHESTMSPRLIVGINENVGELGMCSDGSAGRLEDVQ